MKKSYFYLLCISVVLQSCSLDDNVEPLKTEKTNFPAPFEKYGESVANEIRQTVNNLNEMGVDYSDADNSAAFKERFNRDFGKAAGSGVTKGASVLEPARIDPDQFAERIANLTEIQIKFIERIIKECEISSSYGEYAQRLLAINDDIYAQVPQIEQDRLFYITSVLYYGLNEIDNLEMQGQMLITPQNSNQMLLVKTKSESDGGFGGYCRQLSTQVWYLSVGAIYVTGEVVMAVNPVFVGALLLFSVVLCMPGDTPQISREKCIDLYADHCLSGPCDDCLHYCVTQKRKDPRCSYSY